MTAGGKINRPRTELQRNHLKRRRVARKEKGKGKAIVGAVIDEGLITIHHLKKRSSNKRANITLSGKKKKKLQKQLQHSLRERSAMDVAPGRGRAVGVSAVKDGDKEQDVEMMQRAT